MDYSGVYINGQGMVAYETSSVRDSLPPVFSDLSNDATASSILPIPSFTPSVPFWKAPAAQADLPSTSSFPSTLYGPATAPHASKSISKADTPTAVAEALLLLHSRCTIPITHSSTSTASSPLPTSLPNSHTSGAATNELDAEVEVTPGVRADGKWTSKHPEVARWVRKAGRHGIVPNLLEIVSPPRDFRVWALAALEVEQQPRHPAHWVLWHNDMRDVTMAVILEELCPKGAGSPASTTNPRIHSHHANVWCLTRAFIGNYLWRIRQSIRQTQAVPKEWWYDAAAEAFDESNLKKRKRDDEKEEAARKRAKIEADKKAAEAARPKITLSRLRPRTTTANNSGLMPASDRVTRAGARAGAVAVVVVRPSEEADTIAASRSETVVSTDVGGSTVVEVMTPGKEETDEEEVEVIKTPDADEEGACAWLGEHTLEKPVAQEAVVEEKKKTSRARGKRVCAPRCSNLRKEEAIVAPVASLQPNADRVQTAPSPSPAPQATSKKSVERTRRKSQKALEAADAAAGAPRRSARAKRAAVSASK
ncbi:hypothetical protein OE88DRAFT_1805870 [Heliocybe sulcata]|uniref:Uncharacterized protein n=1 Tax=Heliocybe sulcata TaxID=5364 RepID=A0A5C3NAL0_9AGAM|nr:hypothetical protein OE88DRAFT_1805870 [Heliocybe sulcata]